MYFFTSSLKSIKHQTTYVLSVKLMVSTISYRPLMYLLLCHLSFIFTYNFIPILFHSCFGKRPRVKSLLHERVIDQKQDYALLPICDKNRSLWKSGVNSFNKCSIMTILKRWCHVTLRFFLWRCTAPTTRKQCLNWIAKVIAWHWMVTRSWNGRRLLIILTMR